MFVLSQITPFYTELWKTSKPVRHSLCVATQTLMNSGNVHLCYELMIMSLQVKAHLLNRVECILWPSLCMLVGFNEGFAGAVSQWQSPHNYRLLCCYVKWNRYWRGKKIKWLFLKSFLIQPVPDKCVIHHVCQKSSVFTVNSSGRSLRRTPGCCFSHCKNVFNLVSFTRILRLEWRQKKRHQLHSFSLSHTVCAGCLS